MMTGLELGIDDEAGIYQERRARHIACVVGQHEGDRRAQFLGLADAMTLHISVPDAVFAPVREHYGEREIVELTAVAAAFEMFSRLNSALRIPVTPIPDEANQG